MTAENLIRGVRLRAVSAPLYPVASEVAALESAKAWGLWLDDLGRQPSKEMLSILLTALKGFEGLIGTSLRSDHGRLD